MLNCQWKILKTMKNLLISSVLGCLVALLFAPQASALSELSTRAEFPANHFSTWGCVGTGTSAAATNCGVVSVEGDLSGGGLATAGFGTLAAHAGVSTIGAVGNWQARASATFADTIRIDAPGRGQTVGYVQLTLGVNGDFSGQGSNWSAGGSVSLGLGSGRVQVSGFSDASADAFFRDHDSDMIAVILNTPISFTGGLSVFATSRGTGSATAAMGHTVRVLGFRVFEDRAGTRPFSQGDYTLIADSGTSYPVPEPGTALLMGLGLAGLAIRKPGRPLR